MTKFLVSLAASFFAMLPDACAQDRSSFGYAELQEGKIRSGVSGSDKPGALYQAGSIAKYACTIGILRLADQGLLEIDKPVESILPELAGEGAGRVTTRQLLANRSGLADNLTPQIRKDMQSVMAVESTADAIPAFVLGELAFEPGSRFSYDLVNWILVQALIERVTGASLSDALTEMVFLPAGLQETIVFSGDLGSKAQSPIEPAVEPPQFLQCAGGIASVPEDLIRLLRFANKKGLSQPSLKALRTVTTPEENYSLGGRIVKSGERLLDWQTGSNGAYKSVVVYDPVSDSGFAAMSAQDDWTAINDTADAWVAGENRAE